MIDKLNDLFNENLPSNYTFSRGNVLFKDSRGTDIGEEYNKSDSSLHKTIEQ